ncbi:MAG TPA: glycosyltransferase family 39 protein [Candidatus Dormibacteraeota bacterium]|nr:glycosyltransferase family 39 protein [Candidatus Dormibacteraeota bacterium]
MAMVHNAVALPASLNEYLDTGRSPLNPNNRGFGFYVYGDLPLTIVQLLGRWAARPDTHLDAWIAGVELGTDYGVVYRLGRIVSALCDCLTLVLLYLVGARLYGRAVGLLAAALYAAAVLPIQQAHFFTVDAMANLFVVAALWLAARAAVRARWADDVLFGLALAAGLACKLSVFPIAALLAISVVLRFAAHAQVVRDEALPPEQRRRRTAQLAVRALLSLNVVVLTAVLAFRLLQPYAFVPSYGGPTVSPDAWQVASNVVAPHLNPRWLDQMAKSRLQQVGADDAPPNHQWATRTPFAFPWLNLVQYGLGWPLGLAGWLGWLWALGEGLRGRAESWRHVLPVAWIALCFGWFGAGWVLTMRYFLPLVPALCLTAAWALVRIAAPQWDASFPAAAAAPAWRRAAGGLASALVLVPTYAWALAFTSIYTRPHTRIAASRWLYDTLPWKVALHIEDDHGRTSMRPVGLPASAQPEAAPDAPEPPVTLVGPQAATSTRFRAAGDGVLRSVALADVRPLDGAQLARVAVTVVAIDGGGEARADCEPERGPGVVCRFAAAVPLAAGREYELRLDSDRTARVAGTALATEGSWDDGLPLSLPDITPADADFTTYGLEMAWEDDATKRRRMVHVLDRVDYVVMSSNRFVGSLPRNPRRWPMTIDYYRALFSGALGFELVAEFASPPRLGSWSVDDQDAEEAFTVYDHPRVLIFRKTAAYDPARTAAILGQADLSAVVRKPAIDVQESPAQIF